MPRKYRQTTHTYTTLNQPTKTSLTQYTQTTSQNIKKNQSEAVCERIQNAPEPQTELHHPAHDQCH